MTDFICKDCKHWVPGLYCVIEQLYRDCEKAHRPEQQEAPKKSELPRDLSEPFGDTEARKAINQILKYLRRGGNG